MGSAGSKFQTRPLENALLNLPTADPYWCYNIDGENVFWKALLV